MCFFSSSSILQRKQISCPRKKENTKNKKFLAVTKVFLSSVGCVLFLRQPVSKVRCSFRGAYVGVLPFLSQSLPLMSLAHNPLYHVVHVQAFSAMSAAIYLCMCLV